mgnify:CR=1 FL=1
MAIETQNTLFLLVTCSLDPTRDDLARKTILSLIKNSNNSLNKKNFIVFDNNSKFLNHLPLLEERAKVLLCKKNIGFWNAIYYVVNNHKALIKKSFKYIYIIESDTEFYDLFKLNEAEALLNQDKSIGCVRTQEFRVKLKYFFDKKNSFLPFRVIRSLVSQVNVATDEGVWFKKYNNFKNMYITNFHAKLMCLHRIDSLIKVLNILEHTPNFTEVDFMVEFHKQHKINALIDGGIYYQRSTIADKGIVSGSWSSVDDLKKIGYKNSRFGSLDKKINVTFNKTRSL